jgi:hypothetical protein
MHLSPALLETVRKQPQSTKLYLSIFQPTAIFKAQVNNPSATKGDRIITYDTVSLGVFGQIRADMSMWVGTTPGGMELGKVRVRSATASTITVSENSNIQWQDNAYLTVLQYWEVWPVYPRIILDPSNNNNVIFYKDYDIVYTNQNSILGTFPNAGPHRAILLDPASNTNRIYYTATGSYNLLGDSLSYNWFFEGATVTGSTAETPGYITYNTPGHYVTRLSISGSSGENDTTYRYVSVYDQNNPPIARWQMESMQGSRDEGGYTVGLKVFQIIPIQEHAVVVLFGENTYGDENINIGGNAENNSNIFFVGYVDKDSIQYDYQHSEVSFDAVSITAVMKKSSGFSVSVGSNASPTKWYELLDMDSRRALYHYLRWHTTVLNISDFQFLGQDYPIQFFDSDRGSMYDAIDNYMKNTLIGDVVSDRQGKIWAEVQAMAYPNPTGSFAPVMDITNRDWMNEPRIEERLTNDVSYLEYGGVAYSGNVTGTYNAFIGSAPGDAPSFYGVVDSHEGLALQSQAQLNQMLGNIFANKNSPFPTIGIDASINASNLDIAPQETLGLHIAPQDTVRNVTIDGLYIPNSMEWRYDPQGFKLLPHIDSNQLVNGFVGQTVIIPSQADIGGGFSVNPLQFPPTPLSFPPVDFGGSQVGDGAPSKVLIHDVVAGVIYTTTFNLPNDQVGWFQGNGGLTTTQYQSIQKIIVTPNGAIYVANLGHGDVTKTFLARSPALGQPFTVLLTVSDIQALVGSTDNAAVSMISYNPTVSEDVVVLLSYGGATCFLYRGGGGGTFTSDFILKSTFVFDVGSSDCDMTFGANQWLLTNGFYAVLNSAATAIVRAGTVAGQCSRHTRGGILGNTVHWVDTGQLALGTNNCTSIINVVGNSNILTTSYLIEDALVCDPTGVFMMTSNNASSPIKSSDGGYSWSQMTFLAPLVYHYFANCGDSQRWIAVAGSQSPYYSDDFGSSWRTKTGNLSQIVALPSINAVKVIP